LSPQACETIVVVRLARQALLGSAGAVLSMPAACADRSVDDVGGVSADTQATSAASDTTSTSSASVTESTVSMAEDSGSTSAQPPLASCLPPNAHGSLDETLSDGEFDVYAGCTGGYLIEHLGMTPMTTVDEVGAVRELGGFLLGYPDLVGVGTGLCCRDVAEEACITLYFESDSIDVPDLLDYLRANFVEAEGLCFGFNVTLDQAPPTPD
jgi:hypothetical protein